MLTDAYRSIGSQPAPTSARSLLTDIARILAISSESSQFVPREVVSTDELGLVLITEAAVVEGKGKSWQAVHLWRIRAERVQRFEAYALRLVVTPT